MQTPKRREMKVSTGYDFNGLNAHVSRCLLRQICKRLSLSTYLNSKFEEGEHAAISSSKMNHIQRFYGALIFVDISGFTALSTRLDIESLTTHINGYFKDMLAIIESFGGDVVKFAGDAMYVIWHAKSYNERQKAVLKAVACAKEIVRKCNNRTVPLSPATFDTTETILKRVELARSLLSGQSALERDADPNFDSNDDEDSTTIVNCNETAATFVSDDLESPQSPRSPRVQTHRRRNSLSSHQLKPKTRRLSFPSFSKNASESTDSKDPEVASLNVHIGVSVGVLAGIDVSARNRSEFFLTGQPLLDVSDAESLAKLGQIVVSKGVFEFLQQYSDLNTSYECVSTELECYRIMEPIMLSAREIELRYGPAADVKRELSNILNMSSGLREEQSQRAMLLRCLSSHVHEAARMQSPVYSRCNSPPYISYPGDSMNNSLDNSGSCLSSVYSSTHSDDSFDLGCRNEPTTSQKFERKLSFDNGILPDDVLSAELRELVVLFIKIDLNVSLSHSAAPSATSRPENNAFSPRSSIPQERWDNLTPREEINGEDFVVDKFGFLERTAADESADVALHGRFQACMTILADTFAEHGGQIGQYSCCEKGNVCLGTFGLRGSVQEDNAAAAIESAQTILVRLQAIGFNASIGVTSGKVYSGLVGSPARHEYSIMGPAANLSSRLMCAAAIGTILSDGVTRNRDRSHLFLDMPSINAKGYSEPVRTYQPVLSDTFRRRLYSRRGSIDSWSIRNLTDDPDVFGMIAIDKLSASRNPETYLFGRNNELDAITQFLFPRDDPMTDAGAMEPMKIAIVTGACGCGKTTFLASVREHIAKDPVFAKDMHASVDLIFSGGSNSYDTTVPFNSWRPVLTALIAATSKHARSLIKEEKYTSSKMPGRYTCQGLFSPIDSGESGVASFSPMGRFSSDRTISAFSSKATSPIPPASCNSPGMDDGCLNSPSRRDTDPGMTPGPLSTSAHRFSHIRAGCALITEALPPSVLSHLHLIYKILPSFSKVARSPRPECTLTGAVKLQKTVEVLSSVIQTAVDLIRAKRIFITL
jgi:class 3 adenylate cyclase